MRHADAFHHLGLDRSAGETEIRSAYKRLAMKWHPDKNRSQEATQMFQTISLAYKTLTDPEEESVDIDDMFYNYSEDFGGEDMEFMDMDFLFQMMFSEMGGMGSSNGRNSRQRRHRKGKSGQRKNHFNAHHQSNNNPFESDDFMSQFLYSQIFGFDSDDETSQSMNFDEFEDLFNDHPGMKNPPASSKNNSKRNKRSSKNYSEKNKQGSTKARGNNVASESGEKKKSKQIDVGVLVLVHGQHQGVVRFVGTTHYAKNEFVGVEVLGPMAQKIGKNSGTIKGVEYFKCQKPLTGLMVRPCDVVAVEA